MIIIQGGKCQLGYYCFEGFLYLRECDGGKFCDVVGFFEFKGNCIVGYYCKLRVSSFIFFDEIGGKCS